MVYTVRETAKMLRVAQQSVYRLIYAGSIKTVKIGRQHRIPESEIVRLTTLPEAEHEPQAHD